MKKMIEAFNQWIERRLAEIGRERSVRHFEMTIATGTEVFPYAESDVFLNASPRNIDGNGFLSGDVTWFQSSSPVNIMGDDEGLFYCVNRNQVIVDTKYLRAEVDHIVFYASVKKAEHQFGKFASNVFINTHKMFLEQLSLSDEYPYNHLMEIGQLKREKGKWLFERTIKPITDRFLGPLEEVDKFNKQVSDEN